MSQPLTTGADLAAWRGRLGWSVQRAADELRILAPSLRNIEAGRKAASGSLLRLAEVLERLEGGTTSATPERPAARKARADPPVPPVPEDPFEAACQRSLPRLPAAAAMPVLRAAVARRQSGVRGCIRGLPPEGADCAEWRRQATEWAEKCGWLTSAPLDVVAGVVESEMAKN